MLIFIMRHGEAMAGAVTDADRELTHIGREDVSNMINKYKDELRGIDEVWTSPYTRAQQTADIVRGILHKPIVTQDWLVPTNNPDKTMDVLREKKKTILLVSHQPLVGTLVDRIVGLEPGRYRMGTASIACVEAELMTYGCGELLWLHQPQT